MENLLIDFVKTEPDSDIARHFQSKVKEEHEADSLEAIFRQHEEFLRAQQQPQQPQKTEDPRKRLRQSQPAFTDRVEGAEREGSPEFSVYCTFKSAFLILFTSSQADKARTE